MIKSFKKTELSKESCENCDTNQQLLIENADSPVGSKMRYRSQVQKETEWKLAGCFAFDYISDFFFFFPNSIYF